MYKFTSKRLDELKSEFKGKKIAIIGDLMLDCYFWGDVKRISPEAPVPILELDSEFYRFGGAANVALNIVSLGATPIPIGVVGNDANSEIFKNLMEESKISSEGIIIDNERPTTIKTRVIAGTQHIVRIDRESKKYITPETEEKIIDCFLGQVKEIDGLILQDYNKGVLTPSLIKKIIEIANKHEIIITVDPKFNNFYEYTNATVFKPNRKEAADATGLAVNNKDDIIKVGEFLLEKLNAKYILITLGEDGSILFEKGKEAKQTPTKARKVRDVSGAGDTVISTLTVALVAGAKIEEAVYLANYAGGLVCEEVGIVPIEVNKLINTVKADLV